MNNDHNVNRYHDEQLETGNVNWRALFQNFLAIAVVVAIATNLELISSRFLADVPAGIVYAVAVPALAAGVVFYTWLRRRRN